MGYTLKLDIYYFSLKKIKEISEITRRGEKRRRILTEENDISFQSFFNCKYGELDKNELFKQFTNNFYQIFNNQFISSADNTKAITITNEDSFHHKTINNIIWGSYLGGDTDIEFEVYNKKDSQNLQNKLLKDDVASLHYFYKLWMPIDSNTGILMVQSYTTTGCTNLFRKIIEEFFISLDYKVDWGKCVPKKIITKYLNDCNIYRLKILTKKKDEINPLNPIFSVFKKSKYERFINSFKIPLNNLLNLDNYIRLLKDQLVALDIDYDMDRDDVIMYYKNSKGQQAHASLANIENIYPSIILDDSLKDPNTERPLWNEIDSFTDEILNEIKVEIGYTPR